MLKPTIRQYLSAIGKFGVAALTGSVLAVALDLLPFGNWWAKYGITIFGCVAFVAFVVASYQAWAKERWAAIESEKKWEVEHNLRVSEERMATHRHRLVVMQGAFHSSIGNLDKVPEELRSQVHLWAENVGDMSRSMRFLNWWLKEHDYDWSPEEEWRIHDPSSVLALP